MRNKLKEVTYLTVKHLKNNDIILPSDYSKEFQHIAEELKVKLEEQEIILKDLNQDLEKVDKIVKHTNENLNSIQSSTQKAQDAIKAKDATSLEEVNKELRSMQKQISILQKELFSDTLTGAYNRKWFFDYHLENSKLPYNGLLAFIDLNKFKKINDTYGHIIGDQVLKYLVNFLKIELDFEGVNIIRYAGDEFIVIFSSELTKDLDIENLMLKTQEKLSSKKLKSKKIDMLSISFSYGLVKFTKEDNIETILEKADTLMYENKQKVS